MTSEPPGRLRPILSILRMVTIAPRG